MEHRTPGPWKWERAEDDACHRIIAPDGGIIACVDSSTIQEGEADSALIASSPALLETCKAVLHDLTHKDTPESIRCGPMVFALQIVIDKAEGGRE